MSCHVHVRCASPCCGSYGWSVLCWRGPARLALRISPIAPSSSSCRSRRAVRPTKMKKTIGRVLLSKMFEPSRQSMVTRNRAGAGGPPWHQTHVRKSAPPTATPSDSNPRHPSILAMNVNLREIDSRSSAAQGILALLTPVVRCPGVLVVRRESAGFTRLAGRAGRCRRRPAISPQAGVPHRPGLAACDMGHGSCSDQRPTSACPRALFFHARAGP